MKRRWYATPYALWMLIFTIVPLLFVVYFAFTTRDGAFTTENFGKFFSPGNLPVVFDSFRLAFFCTLICLLIGYPAAYFLSSRDFFPWAGHPRAHPFADVDELPVAHLRDDDASGAQRRHQHGAGSAGFAAPEPHRHGGGGASGHGL